MKKIVLCLLMTVVILSMAGCASKNNQDEAGTSSPAVSPSQEVTPTPEPEEKELTGSLEEILRKLHAAAEIDSDRMFFTVLDEENKEYFIGKADITYIEAVAAEPMINVHPHSIVLLKVDGNANIDDVKKQLKENADGMKWICVGVEPENILVENVGHTIVLIMDNDSTKIKDAFLALDKE
ncbi:MAG: hypothetical protein JXQ23_10795 [Clostridia bacterium]|nr:hypothetical protein [Clostridia bacterium]